RYSADANRHIELHDLAIAVRANRPGREARKAERFDLLNIPAGSARDQAGTPERLVGGTHDLAEGRGDARIIQVLEDDHGWTGRIGNQFNLVGQASIDVAGARRRTGPERGRRRIA